MQAKEIFLSKSHLYAPFTIVDYRKKSIGHLSPTQKALAIGLAVLAGVVSLGIGGVVTFYAVTAEMKANKLNNKQAVDVQTQFADVAVKQVKETGKKRKAVGFKEARARKFEKDMPATDVGVVKSFQMKNLKNSDPKPPVQAAQLLVGKMVSAPYPKSIQERRYPPLSMVDTIKVVKGAAKSLHCDGNEKFYADEEILKLHPSIRTVDIGSNVKVDFTENNKAVIQQQAMRGCTAAVVAMLVFDAGKSINMGALKNTNLGDTDTVKGWIEEAGLKPLHTILNNEDGDDALLKELQQLLVKHGSAIVKTANDIGGHVVVVDHISDDLQQVRLRDPMHGWEITVTKEGFLRGFSGGDIVQLA